jgi:hypothetical protein
MCWSHYSTDLSNVKNGREFFFRDTSDVQGCYPKDCNMIFSIHAPKGSQELVGASI